jgi:HSP20 family molecular chaperone IbpA
MTANDVKVDVKDNYITLSGERKEEHREESADKKSYRLERSYGQVWFCHDCCLSVCLW